MKNMHPIWLTRAAEDNLELAAELARADIPSLNAPLLKMSQVRTPRVPQSPAGLLLTSRYAANALPEKWRDLPVYCVGAATAAAARGLAYTRVIEGEADVLSLLPRIAEEMRGQHLVYFSGEEVAVDVTTLLAAQGVGVERQIVYRAIAATQLAPEVRTALQNNQLSGAMFFSARTAEIAIDLIRSAALTAATQQVDAFCFSLDIAKVAAALPWRTLHVAHAPKRAVMLDMIVAEYATRETVAS